VPAAIAVVAVFRTDPSMDTTPTTAPDRPDPDKAAWTPRDVACELQISDRHLTTLRRTDPAFPPPVMLGRLPRWAPASIHAYMTGQGGPAVRRRGRV
jgi:predicted DNA-binding transcriptional regulator AlpA